jgi:hypothetical protein
MATKKSTSKSAKAKKAPVPTAVGKTFVGIVLDRSGSMSFGQEVTMRGFNEQLQTIQEGAKGLSSETYVSFVVFSDNSQVLFDGVAPDKVEPLTPENYRPSGSTALFDSVDDCISLIEKQPGAKDKDAAILMLVFTDGEENMSRRVTGEQLGSRIKALEDTGQWTFTLLGPSTHIKDMAAIMNLKQGNVQGYDVNNLVARGVAAATMSASTTSYFSARSVGATQVSAFYGEKEIEQGKADELPVAPAVGLPRTPVNIVAPQPAIPPLQVVGTTAQDQRALLMNAIASKTSVSEFFKARG